MTERANQAQIAKVAGVSRATVSFALNERLSSRLAPETRRRVLEAAERVDYRPNRQAQLMRGVKSGLIGIIKPAHMMQTGLELAYYAAQKIYQSDYELVAHELLWGNDDGLRRAINYMLDAKVEGLLLEGITGCLTEDEVARLSAENIPVVTLGSVQPFSIPAVVADYHEGMYDLTLHLLQSGHRDFTYLAAYDVTAKSESDEWSTIRERYAGFCAALATMPANAVTVRTVYEPPSIYPLDDCQPGYDAVRRLVAEKLVPKVLVCTNDSYAIGAMHACIEAGLHIPDEIAITGFDNVTVGNHLSTPLTTVAQISELIADSGVKILLQLMRGKRKIKYDKITKIPCKMVVRQSCGGVRFEDKPTASSQGGALREREGIEP